MKKKVGVLVEDHFDQTEFRMFNEFFPKHGYEVEYISHLWGNPELHFGGNPDDGKIEEHVTVKTEVNNVKPSDYKGLILIGAYAMDRLRYQANPIKGQPNQALSAARSRFGEMIIRRTAGTFEIEKVADDFVH